VNSKAVRVIRASLTAVAGFNATNKSFGFTQKSVVKF
jgi:hypothetical protein